MEQEQGPGSGVVSYDAGTEQAGFLDNLVPLGDLFSMGSPEGVSECAVSYVFVLLRKHSGLCSL